MKWFIFPLISKFNSISLQNSIRKKITVKSCQLMSLMSIERDVLNEINFDEVVETFAMMKARKK